MFRPVEKQCTALHVSKARRRRVLTCFIEKKKKKNEDEEIGLTILSKVQLGLVDSGAIVTQLSRATPAGDDPPQIKI